MFKHTYKFLTYSSTACFGDHCPHVLKYPLLPLLCLMMKAAVIIGFSSANHSTDIIGRFYPHCHPLKEGEYLPFTDEKTEEAQRAF